MNKVIQLGGSAAFIPTFENAAYGIEWTKDDNDIIRIGNAKFHPFIISHTKTMTRTREDGKEEVFSACIKPDDTRYLGENKRPSVVATKLQGRPRTGISHDKANEFCANRGDWDRWAAFNGNNPIVQTYWTAEHNIGNGSTNGDHYELGNYNTDGSNLRSIAKAFTGFFTTVKLD